MDRSGLAIPAPQHIRALERANEVRLARASLKRRISKGDMRACEVVSECPWEAESMKISELLMSQQRWGRTRSRKFLTKVGISENRELGKLTDRQRQLLSGQLAEVAAERAERRSRGSIGAANVAIA